MAEDKKNQKNQPKKDAVKLDPNRHKGKTWADIRDETFEGIQKVIDSDKSLQDRNMSFERVHNAYGGVEYHRYEDNDPNDTNPARLTGIYTQDQMDLTIKTRLEDSFYKFEEEKVQPPIIDKDIEMPMSSPAPVEMSGGTSLIAVVAGQPQYIRA